MNKHAATLGTLLHTIILGCDYNTVGTPPRPSHDGPKLSWRDRRKLEGINIQAELILIKEKRSGLPAITRKLILSTYGAPK